MSGQKQPRIASGLAPLLNLQLRAIDTVDQASRSMTYTLGSFIDNPQQHPCYRQRTRQSGQDRSLPNFLVFLSSRRKLDASAKWLHMLGMWESMTWPKHLR